MNLFPFFFLVMSLLASGGETSSKHGAHILKKEAQRAFLIYWIRDRGILLMEAWKKKKGSHYQLPGGRIDPEDFVATNVTEPLSDLRLDQMIKVGRRAVIREVMEETAIDLSHEADRLIYLPSVTQYVAQEHGCTGFVAGTDFLPRKMYFYLEVLPDEFHSAKVTLSPEHIAFSIQPDIKSAIKQIMAHSGGDSARPLHKFNEDLTVLVTH